MNELDYLRQMRALQRDSTPSHDLWPGIATRLHAQSAQRAAHPAWSIAAAVVLALTGLISQQHALRTPARHAAVAGDWRPRDPRFSAAAIDLKAAREELSLALAQDPDGHYLHTLLARTERQQQRLRQWGQL